MDPVSMMVACVVSSIGLSLFVYGKKQMRPPQLVAGIVLMLLPCLHSGVAVMLSVTVAIVVGLRLSLARGL